jgi:RimJ/RimL family protein N-acetyltransferase
MAKATLALIIERKPEKDGEEPMFIGFTDIVILSPKNRDAMFGIMLLPKAWGRGYGTEVTKFIVNHSFRWLAAHRVSLTVFSGNEGAIVLYKRV